MDESEINNLGQKLITTSNDYHLSKLASILNYQVSGVVLLLFSYFGGIFLLLASLAAIIFIPYLIYVLWIEDRKFWLVALFILILFPILVCLIFFASYIFYLSMIILGLFYIYCFTLRLSVNEWIKEKNWKRQLIVDKLKKNNPDNF